MSTQKTKKTRYKVSVQRDNDARGALKFTFVAEWPRGERGGGGSSRLAPRHIVRVSGNLGNPTFDWSTSPDEPGPARQELERLARTRLAALRDWLSRVDELVGRVEQCGSELGWATRRIEKRMDDSEVGTHQVPALLLQQDTVRVLLEPVSRRTPGAEGVVDLYLMPAYDDIASLYFREGKWRVHYVFPYGNSVKETESKPLSKKTLAGVLHEMKKHDQ
jgi:hypothetical protein